MNLNSAPWTEIITPRKKWFDLRLGELWRYRDLITLFVYRDFVAIYKQTILGPLWHIIQPLMTTLVFTIIFGRIAQIPTDGIPPFLFYLCGITIWNYFAGCLAGTSGTFRVNAQIFGKVYFPRLTVPVSITISRLLTFCIQITMFLVAYGVYYLQGYTMQPSWWLLLLPYLVLLMAILGLSLGIIISSFTTKYRDLAFFVGFGVQLLMYASPVIYPVSILSEQNQYYMFLNPVAPIIEGFRYSFLGSGTFNLTLLAYSSIVTLITFILGITLFHRVEKTFMDTV